MTFGVISIDFSHSTSELSIEIWSKLFGGHSSKNGSKIGLNTREYTLQLGSVISEVNLQTKSQHVPEIHLISGQPGRTS